MSELVVRASARWRVGAMLSLLGCPAVERAGETTDTAVPRQVQETFTTYCALPACHAGIQEPNLSEGNTAQSITGTAMNGQRYVVFGDTANSRLAQLLLPSTPGKMPPVGNPEPPEIEVAIILGWIGGAPFSEEATMTDGSTTSMTDTVSGESSTGPAEPQFCDLALIDPSVDAAMAVDAGDGAMQIPTVIGDVLVRNCGCHYTDAQPEAYGPAYTTGATPMATWQDFQDDFSGLLPPEFGGMPVHAAILERLTFAAPMPPTPYCDPDGEASMENTSMTQADFDLLSDWLTMGAPDGATYEPP